MLMPETAIDENDGAPARQHNVWLAGQAYSPKSEAEAESMQYGPDALLGTGVSPLDAAHIPASAFRCQSIGHRNRICAARLKSTRHDAVCSREPSTTGSEEHTSELQSLRHLVCRLL